MAKNAYKERVVVPVSRKLKDALVSQSQEEAHQEIYDENTTKENLILHPQEGDADQEIRDEIRIKEEQFNEEGGRDQELWREIVELKSLL